MRTLILLVLAAAVTWVVYGRFREASIEANEAAVEKVGEVQKKLEKAQDAQERASEKIAEVQEAVQEAFEE